jgi:H+/Cl- antiporter ClcA/CBS domain-containing protein
MTPPPRRQGFRLPLISMLAAAIGIAAGCVAYWLFALIALVTNLVFFQRLSTHLPDLTHHTLGAWVVVVPALGGLVVGLMAKFGSSKIRGHGIPEAMEAVLVGESRIAPRVAVLKPLSAAISIGTGGPFGAEGPIIQTGGALGSLVGQLLHTTAAERKVLLACGAAAGMAATFSTPIAAVILAIELLLFEFKSRSFIPLVIASTLATTMHFRLLGRGPMFTVGPVAIPFYVVLGLLCGLAAVGFSRALYWVEDRFEALPLDPLWWPALGGLGLGVIGLFAPRVLGVGYGTISDILNGRLALAALLTVLVLKSLALLVSLGSGTSGGLLAPMFMAGAALGGVYALAVDALLPAAHLSPAACALVAMAAVFGAASRATFALIIFAFEITRDYNSVLPLMLVCVLADLVGLALMRNSIMTEKLVRRGLRVHQELEVDVLHQVEVGEVMDRAPASVPADLTVGELARRIALHDPAVSRTQGLAVVDADGRLVGVITRGDILRSLAADPAGAATVLAAGTADPLVAHPTEPLHDAVARMMAADVGRLPVVEPVESADPAAGGERRRAAGRLVGYLGRSAVLAARQRRVDEEEVRQAGWLARLRAS